MLTTQQRTELELYIDTLNSIIADFHILSKRNGLSLYQNDELGSYYKMLLEAERNLRKAESYEEILHAKDIITEASAKAAKLEVFHAI